MSQADELLDSLTEDQVTTASIDPATEPHIVINADRTIAVPEELKHIAVQGDHNIETVTFDCPRYWDGRDLSAMSMRIVFQRPDGHREPHLVENLRIDESDDTMIHFDWTISGNVTEVMGNISFLVCAKLSNVEGVRQNEWHTRLNQDLIVDEGMNCSGDEIVEQNPDILESILVRLDSLESGTTTGGSNSDSTQNVNVVEPAEDDIPKVFYGAELPQTKDDTPMSFRYISKTMDISAYCETKAQGNTSMSYPKKNQTTKLYADAGCTEKLKVDFKGWGKQRKFCFKANWIDITHARNVVSARLWADVVKSRANYAELPELLRTSPNQGAVDGFPVKVYAGGVYQGRYTLNIPKDAWTFNMDDSLDEHCVLCGENYKSGCFRAAANINGGDWSDEVHDAAPESIKTRWNEIINFVMNSTDDEFKANLGNYFYVDSLIDYYLFGLASCGLDAFGKNQIYATYDGQKWTASMYDMDATWGLYWNGGKFVDTSYDRTEFQDFVDGEGNLLYIRLEQLFYEELQSRWEELKNGAMSIENIINRFERFTDIAPTELVKEDYASTTGGGYFTNIPMQTANNIRQIRAFALARLAWTNEYVASLAPVVEVPCTGITLSAATMSFNSTDAQSLIATVTPDGCTDPVTWESNDTGIVTVVDGVVTPVANGSATITAKCGEYSASCSISISGIADRVACMGITLDKTELTFTEEGYQTLTASVEPSDTTDSVAWSSDNTLVATVEDGVVTAVGNGSCNISAICGEQSASCAVTVNIAVTENLLSDVSVFHGYINGDTGAVVQGGSAITICSEQIDVTGYTGTHMIAEFMGATDGTSKIAVYDAEGAVLSKKTATEYVAFYVPENANHIRFSVNAINGFTGVKIYEMRKNLFDKDTAITASYYVPETGTLQAYSVGSCQKINILANTVFYARGVRNGAIFNAVDEYVANANDCKLDGPISVGASVTLRMPETGAIFGANVNTIDIDTVFIATDKTRIGIYNHTA